MTETLPHPVTALLDSRHVTAEVRAQLGFRPDEHGRGVWISYPTVSGRPYEQLAANEAAINAGTPKYMAQEGRGEIPLIIPRPDATRIAIVEGSFDALNTAGYGPEDTEVWGIFGCWNWMSQGVPFAELERARGKDVVIAFDGDAEDKSDIWHAGEELKKCLEGFDAKVRFATGLKGKAGADDVVAAAIRDGADPRVQITAWLANTSTKPGSSKPRHRPPTKPTYTATGLPGGVSNLLSGPNEPWRVAADLQSLWSYPIPNPLTGQTTALQTLCYWQDVFYVWNGAHWAEQEEAGLNKTLYSVLDQVHYLSEEGQPVPWSPKAATVNQVRHAFQAMNHRPKQAQPDTGLVPVINGLIDPNTQQIYPPDPRYFTTYSLPFTYNPAAPAPEPLRWNAFLREVLPDEQTVAALQLWFGYLISGRTDLQKALFLKGAKRSGKGTVLRIMNALVGDGNHVSPTLSRMSTQFGLAPLIGKALVTIGDARSFGDRNASQVTEDLLSIIGEDEMTVDRKNRDAWTGQLRCRFALASNTVPAFKDSSAVVVSRFLFIPFANSFYGREDPNLTRDLLAELPGIFQWALNGLAVLNRFGRLVQPDAGAAIAREAEGQANHLSAFLAEACEFGDYVTPKDEIYRAYTRWVSEGGVPARDWIPQNQMKTGIEDLGNSIGEAQRRVDGARRYLYLGLRVNPEYARSYPTPPGGAVSPTQHTTN